MTLQNVITSLVFAVALIGLALPGDQPGHAEPAIPDGICSELISQTANASYYILNRDAVNRSNHHYISPCMHAMGVTDLRIPIPADLYNETYPPPPPYEID